MLKSVALVLMIALGAPATAQITFQEATASPASGQAKATNPNDKIICERQDEIGSRLGAKKVCKTAAQWTEERRSERNDLEKIQQVVNQAPSR
jgi:Tfp pilus assembly protein PilF